MYGISYEMTDTPNNYIGDLNFELPEGYERYLATRFWDLTMNSTDVTITTTVEIMAHLKEKEVNRYMVYKKSKL